MRCGVSTRYFARQGDFFVEGRDGHWFFQETDDSGRVVSEKCIPVTATSAAEAAIKYDLLLLQKHRNDYQAIVDRYNSDIALAISDLKGMGIHVEDSTSGAKIETGFSTVSANSGNEANGD